MKKRIILVTGDSGSLGCEICLKCANICDLVIGVSRSLTQNVTKLETELAQRYLHISFDLCKTDAIKDLYINHIKPLGQMVGIVNNSAVAYDDIITNARTNYLKEMFDINVFSSIMLTKYAIRDMLLNSIQGSIVHISSVCAHTGYKGLSMYAATKGAMEAFSKTCAREWGEIGIRSNCVAPGFMETKMSQALSITQKDRIYKRTSLKKETSIESVASAVVFLLSDASKSITGEVLHVDNGTI
jgi:3-oxoacyl-[acyl-carrier protein] reductase